MNNKSAIAGTLVDLGTVALVQGDLELAARRYEESIVIGREIEGQFTVGYSLYGLGRVAFARGEYDTAASLYSQALTMFQGTANQWNVTYCLEAFAALAVAQGDMQRAARLFGKTNNFYTQLRFLLSPIERQNHEHDVAASRTALGNEVFSALLAEGDAMTMKEAIAYALNIQPD
jgi:tetratricopeptide (TPR) repeat protein